MNKIYTSIREVNSLVDIPHDECNILRGWVLFEDRIRKIDPRDSRLGEFFGNFNCPATRACSDVDDLVGSIWGKLGNYVSAKVVFEGEVLGVQAGLLACIVGQWVGICGGFACHFLDQRSRCRGQQRLGNEEMGGVLGGRAIKIIGLRAPPTGSLSNPPTRDLY